MKVLLIFPEMYILDKAFKFGLESNGCEVVSFDYRSKVSWLFQKLENKKHKLNYSLRKSWDKYYFETINREHLKFFNEEQPDMVIVYNNEMLLPATIQWFKKRAKIIFLLGDSPYYTFTSNYNLELLFYADLILCPDTGWIKQLEMIGLKNLIPFWMMPHDSNAEKIEPTAEEINKLSADIVFIGGNIYSSWGFKRALFLSKFAALNFKLYGPSSWYRWTDTFPNLKECIVPHAHGRLSFSQVNLIMACSKIYPIEMNPGILNGKHARVFESLAIGIFPLMEYRKDLDRIFHGLEVPYIRNYNKAEETAKWLLDNETARLDMLTEMQKRVFVKYDPKMVISEILNFVNS